MNALPTICTFWHGQLSYLARVCLSSFVEKGHRVDLYAYESLDGVPPGVSLCDAGEVLPKDKMFFYKGNRTPAVFADLFRLELMAQERGIWVDADVYCIRPYADLPEYIFGYENRPHWRNGFRSQINQAVFAAPRSELLDKMFAVFTSGEIPPGMPPWRHLEVWLRRAVGEDLPVHHMQFGATGPMPLNYYVPRLGLAHLVQDKDVFYPLDYGQTAHLLEQGSDISEHISANTLSVHIWNSALTKRRGGALRLPEEDSFLGKELQRLKLT